MKKLIMNNKKKKNITKPSKQTHKVVYKTRKDNIVTSMRRPHGGCLTG